MSLDVPHRRVDDDKQTQNLDRLKPWADDTEARIVALESPSYATAVSSGSTTITATTLPGTDIANTSVTVKAGEVALLLGVATITVASGSRIRLQVLDSSNNLATTQALMYPPTAGYNQAVVFGVVTPSGDMTYRLTGYRDQGSGGGSVFAGAATALIKIVLGGKP